MAGDFGRKKSQFATTKLLHLEKMAGVGMTLQESRPTKEEMGTSYGMP